MLSDVENKTQDTEQFEENIIDIDIDGIKKQKFRINGRPNAIIELDTTDLNVITRLKKAYPKLNKLANEATQRIDVDSEKSVEEQLNEMAEVLEDIDKQMREFVDYIFDSNVSEVCVPSGSMYSPHGGKFTYEHITETLGQLYANHLDLEAKKMSKRLREHTDKYTGKRK